MSEVELSNTKEVLQLGIIHQALQVIQKWLKLHDVLPKPSQQPINKTDINNPTNRWRDKRWGANVKRIERWGVKHFGDNQIYSITKNTIVDKFKSH